MVYLCVPAICSSPSFFVAPVVHVFPVLVALALDELALLVFLVVHAHSQHEPGYLSCFVMYDYRCDSM